MKNMKIVIVDDEEEFVGALVERLTLRGFQARGFTSGEQAMQDMIENDFDVALLDVRMPGSGGLDIIREIKQRWPDRTVILLSGHASEDDAEKGRCLGAFQYLMKPVRIEELIKILGECYE